MDEDDFDITIHRNGLKQLEYHCDQFRYLFKLKKINYQPSDLTICSVLLNPSDKDRCIIGPTIRTLLEAIRHNELTKNFGEITVINLSPYKISDPKKIIDYDVVLNRYHIENEIEFSDIVIFGYGNLNETSPTVRQKLENESNFVKDTANKFGKDSYCFGKTKYKYPIHPFSITFTKNYELEKF